MIITKKWLLENNACKRGIKWFASQRENNAIIIIEKLLNENNFDWANWTICMILKNDDLTKYAIYAAETSLYLYENKYPNDKSPYRAIKLTKEYLNNKNTPSGADCYSDYYAAAAAHAADAAYAAYATATHATADHAYTTYAAAAAAHACVTASAHDVNTKSKNSKDNIIKYGISLIKQMINK